MKLNYIKLFLINYLYLLFLEIMFKINVLHTSDIGLFYTLIFTMPFALLITIVSSLFKKRIINKIINIVLWIISTFIFIAEAVYYSFYKTICGVSAIMYGGQVMEFYNSILVHIKENIVLIIILLIPLIALITINVTNKIKYEKLYKKESIALLVGSIFLCLTTLSLNVGDDFIAKRLVFNTNDLMQTTNYLGVNTSVVLDAIKTLSGFEEEIVVTESLPFTLDEEAEYNITNIDFDKLINEENDATLKSMHKYFKGEEPSKKNEYTGMFAGKNLIFIVAEGFYPLAVDKDVTPTLYKLVNDGLTFNNYYQPIYNCSTSDGEFINQLSLLPGVATCSMKATINTYLPYSLGNIMDNYGYTTTGVHGWTYTYYDRDKTMPNLGYTYYGYDRYNKGYKYALQGIHDSWPTSDIDVVNASYDIYSKDERFMTYYMSISGHLEYNFTGGNYISSKNKSLVSSIKGNDTVKAYVASQVEFDKSLEILLNNLERDGILDDTVIVISPDHYPYGLSNEDINTAVDWMKNPNFDLYRNNLIIYNSEMEHKEIDKYISSLDVLPTILNLFGIKYDSRLLMGRDIFSDSSDLVIFNNKSWITDRGRYDYLKKKYEPFDGKDDKEYVDSINKIVNLKFQMSKLIISKDYYREVLGGK